MERKKKNGVEWLEFELLQLFPEVQQGVVLNPPLGDMEDATHAFQVMNALGLKKGVKLRQCHKDDILLVQETTPMLSHIENFDGMVSQEKGVALIVRHADCQGTLFYDPVQKAIAAVHCGWRGSTLNIYQKTIDQMKSHFGTDPKDLIVCIGPSLGPDNAEFKHYKDELPKHFWEFQTHPSYFDFWEISRMQLQEAGVPEDQIEVAEICTVENEEDCFSYRRNKETPHHGTFISLKI